MKLLKFKDYHREMSIQRIDRALKNIFELLSETNSYVDSSGSMEFKKHRYR